MGAFLLALSVILTGTVTSCGGAGVTEKQKEEAKKTAEEKEKKSETKQQEEKTKG